MATVRRSYRGETHVYPVRDSVQHNVNDGAAGCWCEPVIEELVLDVRFSPAKVVGRIIVHQRIGNRAR